MPCGPFGNLAFEVKALAFLNVGFRCVWKESSQGIT